MSPPPGGSILITRAPKSAIIVDAIGPASAWDRSRMVRSSSARVIGAGPVENARCRSAVISHSDTRESVCGSCLPRSTSGVLSERTNRAPRETRTPERENVVDFTLPEEVQMLRDTLRKVRRSRAGAHLRAGGGAGSNPGRGRRADGGSGPLRPRDPRGVRWPGPLGARAVHRERGALEDERLLPDAHRHEQRHRGDGHPHRRHRGAEAPVPAGARVGADDRRVRAERAERRLRRGADRDDRGPPGRSLRS